MADRTIWLAQGVRTPFTRVDGALAERDAIGLGVPVLQEISTGQVLHQLKAIQELAAMPKGSRSIGSICADGGVGSVALLQAV